MGRKKGYLLTVLTFMFAVCGMIIQMPKEVMASSSGSCGKNLTWYFNSSNGTLTISGSGPMENYSWYNIPWEEEKERITKISVSEGVTTIGNSSFKECSNLSSVILPNSITAIGTYAFSGCSSMENITWSNGLVSIDDYAFSGCSSLESIVIPSKVKTLGYKTFMNCSSVQTLYFNAVSCSDFSNEDTFYNLGGDTNGVKVIFGNGVQRIPASMFRTWEAYAAGNGNYAHVILVQMSNTIEEIGEYAFDGCFDLKSVCMSSLLKNIGNYAFSDCTSLVNIVIPSKVETIGYRSFYNCNLVTSITFNAISCSDFSNEDTFYNLGGNTKGVKVTFGNGVQRVPASMFRTWEAYDAGNGKYAHITSVQMSNTITEVGNRAFTGCYDMKTISMSNKLKVIDEYAFSDCTSLMNIVIPSKVKTIGYRAFYNCCSMTNLVFNAESCSDFSNEDTFYNLGGNTKGVKVTFGNGVKRVPARMFLTWESYDAGNGEYAHIVSVKMADSIKKIGDYAFADCFALKSIILPGKLSYIGGTTFNNSNKLTIYHIEKGIKYKISDYLLDGKGAVVVSTKQSKKLTSASIMDTVKIGGAKFRVKAIANGAFKNCNKLKKVSVGNGVTSLGDEAFEKCSVLEKVTLGTKLTKIGKKCFYGNKKLKTIVIKSKKLKSIGSGSFKSINSKAKVQVPSSRARTYKKLLKKGGISSRVKVSGL